MGLLRSAGKGKLKSLGYADENAYWVAKSGVNKGNALDSMVAYLGSLGYTGTPVDQLRKYLQVQTSGNGNLKDMLRALSS